MGDKEIPSTIQMILVRLKRPIQRIRNRWSEKTSNIRPLRNKNAPLSATVRPPFVAFCLIWAMRSTRASDQQRRPNFIFIVLSKLLILAFIDLFRFDAGNFGETSCTIMTHSGAIGDVEEGSGSNIGNRDGNFQLAYEESFVF